MYAISERPGVGYTNCFQDLGGNFSLTGGFWSLFAVQTPGAVALRRAAGWCRAGLLTGAWSQVSFPYATNATGIGISTPSPAGNRFYRLRKL